MGKRTRGLALLLLAASAGVMGCGKKSATVSGKVTYKDKPVTSGEVIFVTQDGTAGAHAPVQPDGTYKAIDVPMGTLKVGLQNQPPMMPQYDKSMANNPDIKEAKERAALYVPTPPRYEDANQSGLTVQIKSSSTIFNIELQ